MNIEDCRRSATPKSEWQAQRVFQVGRRLREQCARLGLPCRIPLEMPMNDRALYLFEGCVQESALNLAKRTGIRAPSLEVLIDLLERFGTGATRVGPWQ